MTKDGLSASATIIGLSGLVPPTLGSQSALDPQGVFAERVALLLWIMTIGGGAILVGVLAFTAAAILGRRSWRSWLARERLVIGGGIVFPVVVLSALLAYGLSLANKDDVRSADGDLVRIAVVGERWWWRVFYRDAAGRRVESANELRIPVGRTVELELTSADVIHSFWAPKLAGKLDMIPGRTNTLTLVATREGVSRGQCAEYCGGPHALMGFYVVATTSAEFERWLAREALPAAPPTASRARLGLKLFLSRGCGACHAIRGTSAKGVIGPDLTHVGGRLSLGAATLPNDEAAFARWIADNQHIKPENLMPPYGIFDAGELSALSFYLANLR
ncbi:MAG TPA: c-type cytochrome [Methylosinus sp.]